MNQRIRELARLAKDYAHDHEDPDERTSWDYLFETKFAELIAQECIRKIENEAEQYAAPTWAFELVNDIKETFGVQP